MPPLPKSRKPKTVAIVATIAVILISILFFFASNRQNTSVLDSNLKTYQDKDFAIKIPAGYSSTKNILNRSVNFEYKDEQGKSGTIVVQKYLPNATSEEMETIRKLYKDNKDFSVGDVGDGNVGFTATKENMSITYLFKGSSVWKIEINDQDSALDLGSKKAIILKNFSIGLPTIEQNKRLETSQ